MELQTPVLRPITTSWLSVIVDASHPPSIAQRSWRHQSPVTAHSTLLTEQPRQIRWRWTTHCMGASSTIPEGHWNGERGTGN